MKYPKNLILKLVLIVFCTFGLTRCELSKTDKQAISNAFDEHKDSGSDDNSNDHHSDGGDDDKQCYSERHEQPAAQISRSIDILFVMDTSGSMNDNRAKVAEGISSFVGELPANVDYNVAVMLAHGSASAWSGKLFSYAGKNLYSSKTMNVTDISAELRTMVLNAPVDARNEQGEEGSYSLIKGLTTNLALNRQQGFFRTDAALAVVFVSDENDICAPYVGQPTMPGLTNTEKNIRNRDCLGGIATDTVISQVKAIQGDRPYLFGAVTHENINYSDAAGNDSYGFGYMEIVQASNGVSTEINDGDYSTGLANMGKLATSKLNLVLDYKLAHDNADASTIKVFVDNSQVDSTYDTTQNEVHLSQGGGANSTIDINYCSVNSCDQVTICHIPPGNSNARHTITVAKAALSAHLNHGDFVGTCEGGPAATPTPTPVPTAVPTPVPTAVPTPVPTAVPTPVPTAVPTPAPTAVPTPAPTAVPTPVPTAVPTPVPTAVPTPVPTAVPTPVPTPIATPVPTPEPTAVPTPEPTAVPTPVPTAVPTPAPTAVPTPSPTPAPAPFNILGFDAATSTDTAFLLWYTPGTLSTSVVRWGLTPGLENTTAIDQTMIENHEMTIPGLVSGTTYYFQSASTDAFGNTAYSGIIVKTTK